MKVLPKPLIPHQVETVLTWVNSQREQRGLERLENLPKGIPGKFEGCPIALAMTGPDKSVIVASWGWRESGDEESAWNEIPDYVADFIRKFDTGTLFQEFNLLPASGKGGGSDA